MAPIRRIRKWNLRRKSLVPGAKAKAATFNSVDSGDSDPGCRAFSSTNADPQIIPLEGMDQWALFLLLKETFGDDNFRMEQKSDSYNVWAERELSQDDIDKCRI